MTSIFVFRSIYNKTIIRYGICDIQDNQGGGTGYQPEPKAAADNPYREPIIVYKNAHNTLITLN